MIKVDEVEHLMTSLLVSRMTPHFRPRCYLSEYIGSYTFPSLKRTLNAVLDERRDDDAASA